MKKILNLLFALMLGLNVMASENLVVNGDFSDGINGWTISYQKAADETSSLYTVSAEDNVLTVAQGETKPAGRLDITQDVPVTRGKEYVLSFEYTATHPKLRIWSFFVSDNDVWVYVNGTSSTEDAKTDPFRTNNGYFEATTEWVSNALEFTVPDVDSIQTFRLQLRVYRQETCTTQLRNIQLVEKTPTALNELDSEYTKQEKIFKSGNLYIKRDGDLYIITGMKLR